MFAADLKDGLWRFTSAVRGHRLEALVEVKATTRILYISPVGERGGAETVLLNILKYHNRDLYEPAVGFLRTGPLVQEVERLGVRTVAFPTTRFRHLLTTARAIRSIRAFIREEDVGLIFGNMPMGHLYGGLAAIGSRTAAIWFLHGIPDGVSLVDLAAARIPGRIVFVFTEAARRAVARLHPAAEIVVVPGCVDLARFDPLTVTKGLLRHELGTERDGLIVAHVARLQRWKGQSLFLQAAALVHRSLPKCHFVLVGGSLFGLEQSYAEEIRKEASRLLPSRNVHFLGHRHDLPEILADVDLLIHCPQTREPFGLDALEAMAMGVPVVGTRTGNTDEVVAPGETGALVPPGDPVALANAIKEVLSDPVRRTAMGQAARRRAEDKYSAEHMVRHLESVYARVLSNEH